MSEKKPSVRDEIIAKYTLCELTQGLVEKFMSYLHNKRDIPMPNYNGEMLRGAVLSGWITNPKLNVITDGSDEKFTDDVGKMPPLEVKIMATHLDTLYRDATTVPPN